MPLAAWRPLPPPLFRTFSPRPCLVSALAGLDAAATFAIPGDSSRLCFRSYTSFFLLSPNFLSETWGAGNSKKRSDVCVSASSVFFVVFVFYSGCSFWRFFFSPGSVLSCSPRAHYLGAIVGNLHFRIRTRRFHRLTRALAAVPGTK